MQVFTLTVLFLCKACGAFIISQLAPRNEWSACPGSGRAKVPPCAVPGKYLPKIPSGDNCRGVAQWTPGPGRAPGQGSTPQLLILILGHLSFENIPSCLFRIFSLRTLATRHQMGPNVYTETDTHLGTYLARHMGLTLAPAQHAWTCVKK